MPLAIVLSLAAFLAMPRASSGLQSELARLGVDTALVLPSSALDDFPVWSPDSRYVAANVMGTWNGIDLQRIRLVPGTWRGGQKIGVVEARAMVAPLDLSLLRRWKPKAEPDPVLAENAAIRIEFRQEDLRISLVVTRRGKAPVVKWTSGLEECGAPVLSPDGSLVAFLCLTNGLFVMDLAEPGADATMPLKEAPSKEGGLSRGAGFAAEFATFPPSPSPPSSRPRRRVARDG